MDNLNEVEVEQRQQEQHEDGDDEDESKQDVVQTDDVTVLESPAPSQEPMSELKLEFKYESLSSDVDNDANLMSPNQTATTVHTQQNATLTNGYATQDHSQQQQQQQQPQLDKPQRSNSIDLNILERIKSAQITNKEIINYILNLLVHDRDDSASGSGGSGGDGTQANENGEFDMEKNFVIKNFDILRKDNVLFELLKYSNGQLKAELWSIIIAILRKSQINLQICVDNGFIEAVLGELEASNDVCADLIIEMLTVLASYSIKVDELKDILYTLKTENKTWKRNSVKLLNVLKAMTHRYGPDEFFSLPGHKNSGISLPPMRTWPHQQGFTISTWFRIDPIGGTQMELRKPYLYWLATQKSVGYMANFMGSCLVLTYSKGGSKEFQHCIQFEFKAREWYMITISHQYNRWSKSTAMCYINGNLFSQTQLPFNIDSMEPFDRCFFGCTPDGTNEQTQFCGQLSTLYLFNQSIDAQYIEAMFLLGVAYKNQFRNENECSYLHLNKRYLKLIYDGKLNGSIVFAYNPVNCDTQLVLQSAPKNPSVNYFLHNSHALLLNQTRAIHTQSIYSSLLSIGGVQVLYLLFNQLDYKQHDDTVDYSICTQLIQIICDMIEASYTVQIQMINTKGFLAISCALEKSSKKHINDKTLACILNLTKFLVKLQNPNGTILLKQLLDHILFNPSIWVYCSIEVQTKLYSYISTEFVNDTDVYNNIRRISAVIQMMHALKYYYWIINPINRSGYETKALSLAERPTVQDICSLRSYILLYIKELVTKDSGVQDDELQALLNYLHTVHEDDNLLDVLNLVVALMSEHPPSMIPAFDRKYGLRTVFKLLGSTSESIRIRSLKLIGFYLQKCTIKRKSDSMNPHNLFQLLTDRLLLYQNEFSMPIYNTLYEILVERTVVHVIDTHHTDPDSTHRIENSSIIKTIAALLRTDSKSMQIILIKKQFLNDLINLCKTSQENRRTILQMSVWQEFLIALAYISPSDEDEIEITNLVFTLFKILLYHAIKHEFGGWRVWIDTLSILHSRVSKEEYQCKVNSLYEDYEKAKANFTNHTDSNNQQPLQLPPFRIPEFKWSHIHKRLLRNILDSIDDEIQGWKKENTIKSLSEAINSEANSIFCINVIHIISQLADVLTNACGGLLPLLASATSNSNEIEILENTEGMTNEEAYEYLERITNISDLILLANNSSFLELEQEKNMPNGSIIRQALRLTFTYAVKNCLESRRNDGRYTSFTTTETVSGSKQHTTVMAKDPVDSLLELQLKSPTVSTENTKRSECLLQDIDTYRLKAILYRDVIRNERHKAKPIVNVEDTKQSQYIALAMVYFTSVLMVSRYRDVIETNSQASKSGDTKSIASVSSKTSVSKKPEQLEESLGNDSTDQSKAYNDASVNDVNQSTENGDVIGDKATNGADHSTVTNGISSIQLNTDQTIGAESAVLDQTVDQSKLPTYPQTSTHEIQLRSNMQDITQKLEKTLYGVAPFLRDIFTEFSFLLSKIIVGSHGQELISAGLFALKPNSSVIELVMLLCSQEWQTSLQKHAGLSFIELVNEGRLLAHASKDHIVRVANEAEFILNRLRAEDVKKHAEYEQQCAQTTSERKEEEVICEHLITAARKRDHYYGIKLKDKILNLVTDRQGCWYDSRSNIRLYWKLDNWEDDSRRRRRLVRNPNGTSHTEATLSQASREGGGGDDGDVLNNELNKQLIGQRLLKTSSQANDEELQVDEKDLEQEFTGPIHYTTKCKLICPVCTVTGTLSITANELYFEVDEDDETCKTLNEKLQPYVEYLHGKWHFSEIRAIFSRRYLLQNTAIEIFTANRSSVMFAFPDKQIVKKVVNILPKVGVGMRYGLPQTRRSSLASPQQLFRSSNMTQKWQRREISNFEYLIYLNTIAGRTYNDLNQYFIFPWILTDYDSPKIDLNSPAVYRDLSKPIGALNPSRRQVFIDRYQNWDAENVPAFHYGTHYSTAAFVLNWLIRLEPFTSIFLNMQGNKFDHADRIFHSVSTSWRNSQRDTSDVKELIPEFFYLPEMFLNMNEYNLGQLQDQTRISDASLPKWAKNPYDFVRVNRQALESEYVSCQLHQWIDLIFGYKQRGPEAIRACNVFYYLTYEGAVQLEQIEDPVMKQSIENQIKHFGQTPSQLLTEPHPPRMSAMSIQPMMFQQPSEDICMMMKFLSNAPIIFLSANTCQTLQLQAIVTISSKHEFSVNKYNPLAAQAALTHTSTQQQQQQQQQANSDSAPSTPTGMPNSQPILQSNPSGQSQTLSASQQQQVLPIQMDQLLVFSTGLHRRQLGENFDERLQLNTNNFLVTYDNKYLLASGFWDKSFRIFNTDYAKLVQIVYGHYDIVTCINRSEMTHNGNCFIATGSRDSTIMIWIWNGHKGNIVNKDLTIPNPNENPAPGAILTGHSKEIVAVLVSSELGIVVSASKNGPVLVHTVYGELLRQFEQLSPLIKYEPSFVFMSQDGEHICVLYETNTVCVYTVNGKELYTRRMDDHIHSIVMSQDGQFVIMGGEKGIVYVYRLHELTLLYAYPQCDTSVRSLALTFDQKFIIAGLSNGCLVVYNINFNTILYRNKRTNSSS